MGSFQANLLKKKHNFCIGVWREKVDIHMQQQLEIEFGEREIVGRVEEKRDG